MNKEIYRHSIAHKPQFAPKKYVYFNVEPLTGVLGAKISGLNVASQIGNPLVAEELRLALSQHYLLLFRDQSLDVANLRQFGQLFGALQINPAVTNYDESMDVMLVRQEAHEHYNFAGNWHTDVPYLDRPAGETALYAMEVPPCGGDTHFANTALAFEALSEELKSMLQKLRAVHELERTQREFACKKQADAEIAGDQAANIVATHPVVRSHPVTREQSLYVSEQFTTRFAGMTEEESQPFLENLFHHQVRPDFTCRVRWRKGTLAIWDNRTTIHYASNDYPGIKRLMMRVSTVGEQPIQA